MQGRAAGEHRKLRKQRAGSGLVGWACRGAVSARAAEWFPTPPVREPGDYAPPDDAQARIGLVDGSSVLRAEADVLNTGDFLAQCDGVSQST